MIILGDILYHGPRNDLPFGYAPKKVISLLNEIKDSIIAIKGNCDAEVDEMVLEFPILPDPQTIQLNGKLILLTHGHKYDFDGEIKGNLQLILHGHTHLLRAEKNAHGVPIVNPGSVSIPRNGNPCSFAILEENSISIYDLSKSIITSVKI